MLSMRLDDTVHGHPASPPYRRYGAPFESCDAIDKSAYLLPRFSPLSTLPDPFWDSFLNQDSEPHQPKKFASTANLKPAIPLRNPFRFPRHPSPSTSALPSLVVSTKTTTPAANHNATLSASTTSTLSTISSLSCLPFTSTILSDPLASPSFDPAVLHAKLVNSRHEAVPLSLTPLLKGGFFVGWNGEWTGKARGMFSVEVGLHIPLPSDVDALGLRVDSLSGSSSGKSSKNHSPSSSYSLPSPTSTITTSSDITKHISTLDPGPTNSFFAAPSTIPNNTVSPAPIPSTDFAKLFIASKPLTPSKEPTKSEIKSLEISLSAIVDGASEEGEAKVMIWQKATLGTSPNTDRRVPSIAFPMPTVAENKFEVPDETNIHPLERHAALLAEEQREDEGYGAAGGAFHANFERLQVRPLVRPTGTVERNPVVRVVVEVHAVVMRSEGYGKAERRVKVASCASGGIVMRGLF